MKKRTPTADPQSAFCEVCAKRVPKATAVMSEGRDYVAYFCSNTCYERWQGPRAPAAPSSLGIQEGAGRSKSRDERVKRAVKRHPQRDEPLADSVEKDETS
jgi:YHS domain-containing protein